MLGWGNCSWARASIWANGSKSTTMPKATVRCKMRRRGCLGSRRALNARQERSGSGAERGAGVPGFIIPHSGFSWSRLKLPGQAGAAMQPSSIWFVLTGCGGFQPAGVRRTVSKGRHGSRE